MKPRDLIVIGGGAGGLVVASGAAQLGLDVVLIEKEAALGGDCLHPGCVPSKTLIHAARVAHTMRRAGDCGLKAVEPEVDLGAVADHVAGVISHIQRHDDPERFRSYGCEVIFGAARFTGPREVEVDGQRIAFRRAVVATGSSPWIPPIEGLAGAGYLTNLDLFDLRRLPEHLVVLGAGPVGMEMAQAFLRLGSRVTVVQRSTTILKREDPEISDTLAALLRAEGMTILTGTGVERIETSGGIRRVVLKGGGGVLEADRILVAMGHRPALNGLGLEAAGVAHDRGRIQVDRRMRSSNRRIFACGDVCGPYPFTHMAEYQAGVVIANAVLRIPKKADYRVVPRVTFTDPEIASVGLTEAQARDRGMAVDVLRFEFSNVDRAITDGSTGGLVKLVTRKGRILGGTILGPHAGELLHEIVLAMRAGIRIGTIGATIHAYPTLAQVHRRTVNTYYGPRLFNPRVRRLVRWINRLLP
jgi:pyruvate/2-oxoglutarate dehydrogenase complex dihydrolipoamide dehydrogenase (E3) component